jgi:uncharacterized protein (TIGR02266 family)
MDKRKYERFTKRLEAEFKVGEQVLRGILSDLSENGVFIRTTKPLAPGSPVEMNLYLPEGKTAKARGVVRRAIKTNSPLVKNGMGVELTNYDNSYGGFIKKVVGGPLQGPDLGAEERQGEEADYRPPAGQARAGQAAEPAEFTFAKCASCGAKNKIPVKKVNLNPRCGKCGEPLPIP